MGRNSQQVFVRIRDKAMDKVIFNQWLQGIFGNPVNLDGTVDVKFVFKVTIAVHIKVDQIF